MASLLLQEEGGEPAENVQSLVQSLGDILTCDQGNFNERTALSLHRTPVENLRWGNAITLVKSLSLVFT